MSGSKPKILIAVDWYLPGFKGGGPIRSIANLVAALSEDFDFFILTSDRDHGDKEAYPGIECDNWVQGNHGEQIWYCSPDQKSYRHLRSIMASVNYDLLYLNSMFSMYFTIFPMWISRATFPDKPVLLAPRGMLHAGALALKPAKKKAFLRLLRLLGLPKQLFFHATDEQEVMDIQRWMGAVDHVYTAPNLGPSALFAPISLHKETGKLRMVYLSRLSAKKGLDFLLERLKTQTSAIELLVAGPDEEKGYWEQCSRLVQQLPTNIQVHKMEAVPPPEAIQLIQSAHLFVLPTKGENFGHAILEAMAAGRPVLISDQTPWKDLEATYAGKVIPLEDAKAWQDCIREFAEMDHSTYQHWEVGARRFAMEHIQSNPGLAGNRHLFQTVLLAADAARAKSEGKQL